jgi:hypothetical protein
VVAVHAAPGAAFGVGFRYVAKNAPGFTGYVVEKMVEAAIRGGDEFRGMPEGPPSVGSPRPPAIVRVVDPPRAGMPPMVKWIDVRWRRERVDACFRRQ